MKTGYLNVTYIYFENISALGTSMNHVKFNRLLGGGGSKNPVVACLRVKEMEPITCHAMSTFAKNLDGIVNNLFTLVFLFILMKKMLR